MDNETTLNGALGIDGNEDTSSNEAASTNEEALNQDLDAAAEEQPEQLEIPKKFVGKTQQEILRAYNDLEKQFHKVSSERAEERKSRDEMDRRVKELEAKVSTPPTQISRQHQEVEEEVDPLADYDKQFDEDPKGTIKQVLSRQQVKAQRDRERAEMERDAAEANDFYSKQKVENQDFASLEPKMQQLAVEYHDLVKPNKLNSVKALKLLHLAARGASVEKYVGEAVKRAKNEGQTVRQEKKQAFSETTRPAGEDKVNFADLDLQQMAKVLGRADE